MDNKDANSSGKKKWVKPELRYIGNLSELLQGGGGKSGQGHDGPDVRKPGVG